MAFIFFYYCHRDFIVEEMCNLTTGILLVGIYATLILKFNCLDQQMYIYVDKIDDKV